MKRQKNIIFLMVIFILFSASIGILHGRKKGVEVPAITEDVRLVLEQQDAIDYVQPYLLSGNIDATAAALAEFTDPLLLKTVDTILHNKTIMLTEEQKVQLLAAMLAYDKNKQKQKMIIERLVRYFADYPVFMALVPQYTKMIPLIVSALSKDKKEQLASWVKQTMDRVIQRNNVNLLTSLYEGGMPLDTIDASSLLYRMVAEHKKAAFVPFLVQQLKAEVNSSPDGKYTPLMKAVEENNEEMVKALLAEGADPDQIVDPQVGNARQIAFEHGYIALELILKQRG